VYLAEDLHESTEPLVEAVYFPEMPKLTLTQRMDNIEQALGIRPRRTVVEWTRDHKLALIIAIGTVALVGFEIHKAWEEWSNQRNEDFKHIVQDAVQQRIQPLDDRLGRVEQHLSDIDRDVQRLLDKALKTTASLTPNQFQKKLDVATTQLSVAASLHAPSGPETSRELQTQLSATSPATPFYWSAAGAFVSYRSSAGKPPAQTLFTPWLGPCGTLTEKRSLTNMRTGQQFSTRGLSYLHCEADLDGQPTIENVILEESVVVYRGGNVSLKNVQDS
jgi:hypothetical protein